MSEAVLNALAQRLVEMTLSKTRYDLWDLQWYTEGPFWRRTSMRYSREYKIIPDYEIADAKHGKYCDRICASYGNIKGVKKNGVSKGMSKSRLFI